MFAMEHWGVEPDLMTLAKSLAAGMPLGSVVGRKEMMDHPQVGGLGGTYGGNPVCCRAALAVLEAFEEEGMVHKAEALGKKIRTRFEAWKTQYELVGDVRGLGAMQGMEMVRDRESKEPAAEETKALVKHCYENGLIVLSCGNYSNVIRMLMPLVITDEQVERGLSIMEEGLAALSH